MKALKERILKDGRCFPEILSQLPETVRNIFSSGITTGGVMAILTNALIHIKED